MTAGDGPTVYHGGSRDILDMHECEFQTAKPGLSVSAIAGP